jgi:hypothetical protein
MHIVGKGKYKVWFEIKPLGDDLLIILGGGEQSHIGAMVICEPGQPSQVIKVQGHYDYIVVQPLAEHACQKYHKRVVALGGIHIENATKVEIERVVQNCKELETCI